MDSHRLTLIRISGEDRPGITSDLTKILAQYNVNILDIGQATIHSTLSLGILIEIPENVDSSLILKDVLLRAYELKIKAKFEPITLPEYDKWVKSQGKGRYIVTLLGRKLTSGQIADITKIVFDQGLNIEFINRLSGRASLEREIESSRACVEFQVRGNPEELEKMKSEFIEVSHSNGVDVAFQKDGMFRRNRRLVCFDMDSTLIQAEVIVELAKAAGVGKKVHEITEEAMKGEIDFNESFKKRVALLKGLEISVMEEIAEKLPITEGAERLISTLSKFGYKTAIISGGFTYFAEYLQKKLGFDYIYANELEVENGRATGRHRGEIVDGKRKAELLREIAKKEGIQLDQVIAVGDGANDLPMLSLAGLGIAFHAKPLVKESAQHSISTIGLDGILYMLGFRDRVLEDEDGSKG